MKGIECKICAVRKCDEDTRWKVMFALAARDGFEAGFIAKEFAPEDAPSDPYLVFACGEQHALILFERWLATKTFDSGPQVSGPIEPAMESTHG